MTKRAYLSVDYAYPTSPHADKHGGDGYYAIVQSVATAYEIAGPYGPFANKKAAVYKAVHAVNEARQKGWLVTGIDEYMAALA